MDHNFTKVMSGKTAAELIKIITVDSGKYQEAALEAARKEIESRNIDSNKINTISQQLETNATKKDSLDKSSVSSLVRFINFLIDFLVIFIVYGLIVPNFENVLSLSDVTQRGVYRMGTLLLFFATYYILFEHIHQKTLGKIITKTKVVNAHGEKASLHDIVIRTLCRLIPFDRFSYFFTRTGFHDAISNTKVIKDSRVPEIRLRARQ